MPVGRWQGACSIISVIIVLDTLRNAHEAYQ